MTTVDPDPYDPAGAAGSTLGGRDEPDAGDPTEGGKRGRIGKTASISADEPDDGGRFPVGGGSVPEERNAPPAADPGPGA